MMPVEPSAGIYIHIPFCLAKCRYCDFYSVTDRSAMAAYAIALQREMILSADMVRPADTLYFGGGTPSVMPAEMIARLIDQASVDLALSTDAEITLEMNPATTTAGELQALAVAGVNRLTIGIQSFNAHNLTLLGRVHSSSQAVQAVRMARQTGFDNIGLDLIYGLPSQTIASWQKDLSQALELSPEHMSCYMLSYEPGTPLHTDLQAGRINPLADRHTADLFRVTHALLTDAGYEHYEIANFAKGFRRRSRHNQKYWNFVPYIGLGPSAHGFAQPRRWWNHRSLMLYLTNIEQERLPRDGCEQLTFEQQLIEALYLGLRQSDGIDTEAFERRFQIDFTRCFASVLDRLAPNGWIEDQARRCRLTPEGMLFLDGIVAGLVAILP